MPQLMMQEDHRHEPPCSELSDMVSPTFGNCGTFYVQGLILEIDAY